MTVRKWWGLSSCCGAWRQSEFKALGCLVLSCLTPGPSALVNNASWSLHDAFPRAHGCFLLNLLTTEVYECQDKHLILQGLCSACSDHLQEHCCSCQSTHPAGQLGQLTLSDFRQWVWGVKFNSRLSSKHLTDLGSAQALWYISDCLPQAGCLAASPHHSF